MDLFQDILSTKNDSSTPQSRMKASELATAVVKENWNQELPGHVKVEYVLGEEGERSSDWIRVLHGYAGNEFGSYALPEIGSEVLVGFILGDSSNAVVLGCLHNSDSKIPENVASQDNTVKQFKTKGGHEINCYEEKGKEKIEIKTPGKLMILMDDETKKIVIKEEAGTNILSIDGTEKSVILQSEKRLELSSGSAKIVLDGSANKIEISASQLELSGKQSLQLSSQSFKAEGATTEIKAKGSMTLESSGIAQIKGAMLKLN